MESLPLKEPTFERRFKGHRKPIKCLDFNPNMKELASCAEDGIYLWNFDVNKRVSKIEANHVNCLNYAPSGNLIAYGMSDKKVHLTTCLPEKRLDTSFEAHLGPVTSVNFSSIDDYLLTSSEDKSVKLWDVSVQKLIIALKKHTEPITCAKFSGDGKMIASGGLDKKVVVWDVQSRATVFTVPKQNGVINSVAFHPSGSWVAAAQNGGVVKLWDIRMQSLMQQYHIKADSVNSIDFHPTENYLLTGSSESDLKIFDLMDGRVAYTAIGHSKSINAVCFSSSGDYFASGSSDLNVLVWKMNFENKDSNDGLLAEQQVVEPPNKSNTAKTGSGCSKSTLESAVSIASLHRNLIKDKNYNPEDDNVVQLPEKVYEAMCFKLDHLKTLEQQMQDLKTRIAHLETGDSNVRKTNR